MLLWIAFGMAFRRWFVREIKTNLLLNVFIANTDYQHARSCTGEALGQTKLDLPVTWHGFIIIKNHWIRRQQRLVFLCFFLSWLLSQIRFADERIYLSQPSSER